MLCGILPNWRVAWHKQHITYSIQLLPLIKFLQSYLVLNASTNYCIMGELMKTHAVRTGVHVITYWRHSILVTDVWPTRFHGNRFLQNVPKLTWFHNIQTNTFILQVCHWRNVLFLFTRSLTFNIVLYYPSSMWSNWLKLADVYQYEICLDSC